MEASTGGVLSPLLTLHLHESAKVSHNSLNVYQHVVLRVSIHNSGNKRETVNRAVHECRTTKQG